MRRTYQICTRCIMDTTDPDIEFDENGVCNHCRRYEILRGKIVFTGKEGERRLNKIVSDIKEKGKNQKYDCVIGLSGGVDSTYTAYLVKKLGLRPLAIHLDNGWDTEYSVRNIENIVKRLNLDLYTHVVDWEEFRDIHLAYLRAGVVDIEVPTDHAIVAILYKIADEKRIKYILIGNNFVTEGIFPEAWAYNKNDLINLKAIHDKFGTHELETFPTLGLLKLIYYHFAKNIRSISILNYVPYVKEDAKKLLVQELDWKDYGHKHYESVFTRFYQGYILPRRFNIDKRRSHLSALICSGQIKRDDALKVMESEPYDGHDLASEKAYVLKKLQLTDEEFNELMNLPIKSHLEYKSDAKWFRPLRFIYKIFN